MTTANLKQKTNAQVIVVGAGPVGLLTALRLGQAGIDTLVLEGHDTLLNTTRAIVYMPVVLPVLRKLGILDSVLAAAYFNTEGIAWRDIDGKQLARLPLSSDHSSKNGVILLGQARMNAIILEILKKYPSVDVQFSQKLASINDDPSSPTVTLTATNPKDPNSKPTQFTTSYVLGTDGANSTTRRLLSIPFEGFNYQDLRMIGIDIAYDFTQHESFTPLNFVVHPTDWAVIVYTGQDADGNGYDLDKPSSPSQSSSQPLPQWRIAYTEQPTLPSDPSSIQSRALAQIKKYTLHDPSTTSSSNLLRAEAYQMQQRHANPPFKHRCFLAGDALHSNNPIGGLGLTTGILDSFCYGNAFIRVLLNRESPDVLAECATSRVETWKNVTNKLSQANLERLLARDESEAGKERAGLFEKLNGDQGGKVAEGMRLGMEKLMVDDFSKGTEKWNAVGSSEM